MSNGSTSLLTAGARISTAEADRDREEQERQEAVESLQLKKFNHRKKFQRALFESK
jgi:hypothetical protein